MRSKFFIYDFLCLIIGISACQNPLEDVYKGFKPPLEDGRISLFIRDYENKFPENTTFEILGKDAALVVNTLNDRKLKIDKEGNLLLGLQRGIQPSEANPVNFSIRISAEGYTPFLKQFRMLRRSNYGQTARLGNLG
jgi:hypothetical protein